MKKLLPALLLLTACGQPDYHPDFEAKLQNPLFAEQYAEAMVDAMVNLEIYQDPILEDEGKKKVADKAKEFWLEKAKKARAEQREGSKGGLLPMKAYVEGEVLYRNNTLYFPAYFLSTPHPSVHVFLSKVIDPRDAEFPDPTALDLGLIQSAFGPQAYAVPEVENPREYRTVVLWDTKLERLLGFAQIDPLY